MCSFNNGKFDAGCSGYFMVVLIPVKFSLKFAHSLAESADGYSKSPLWLDILKRARGEIYGM